ncbi:MAG: lipoate--protein ligase [Sporomusaceae bacterium]|nr:lipoate--protein ligase [Sporomusaceae bacterium]
MLYLPNDSTDPYFNLALEETIFSMADPAETYLLLWQNSPSVIIGKHQNTLAEINSGYISRQGIKVVRRMTGGGAVYHDLGNLNYSFIQPGGGQSAPDFETFTRPVVAALAKLGATVEFSGRNDLTLAGKKISGSAQCIRGGKILHHGTLLFAVDLERLETALTPDPEKIASKGVASVRSRVTNISDHLTRRMSVAAFKATLLACLAAEQPLTTRPLAAAELAAAASLADSRYRSWDWIYGQSPPANIRRSKRFAAGKLEAWLDVAAGRVRAAAFYGDFFSAGDPAAVAAALTGLRYERRELAAALAAFDIAAYFSGMSGDDVLAVLID